MEWEFQIIYHQLFKYFEAIVAKQNQLLLLAILMLVVAVLISDEKISKLICSKSSLQLVKNYT